MKMKELVIATKNKHKADEITLMVEPLGYTVYTLFDFDELPEIEETGDTFHENAYIKAKTLSDYLQKDVLADDSGLEVFALDKKPGVHSARYAGPQKSDTDNNQLLLKNMEAMDNKEARFVKVLCFYQIGKEQLYFEGYLEGSIATKYKGTNGFGYDPIFKIKGSTLHLAEIEMEEKNRISHRANALRKLIAYIQSNQEVL